MIQESLRKFLRNGLLVTTALTSTASIIYMNSQKYNFLGKNFLAYGSFIVGELSSGIIANCIFTRNYSLAKAVAAIAVFIGGAGKVSNIIVKAVPVGSVVSDTVAQIAICTSEMSYTIAGLSTIYGVVISAMHPGNFDIPVFLTLGNIQTTLASTAIGIAMFGIENEKIVLVSAMATGMLVSKYFIAKYMDLIEENSQQFQIIQAN